MCQQLPRDEGGAHLIQMCVHMRVNVHVCMWDVSDYSCHSTASQGAKGEQSLNTQYCNELLAGN